MSWQRQFKISKKILQWSLVLINCLKQSLKKSVLRKTSCGCLELWMFGNDYYEYKLTDEAASDH